MKEKKGIGERMVDKNLFRSWVWILLDVDDKSSKMRISKRTNITNPHVTNVVNKMIKEGLLEIKREKRWNNKQRKTHIIILTDKGRRVREYLIEVKRLLEEKDE